MDLAEAAKDCPSCAPSGYRPSMGQTIELEYKGLKAPYSVRGPYTGTKYRVQRKVPFRAFAEDAHFLLKSIPGLEQV